MVRIYKRGFKSDLIELGMAKFEINMARIAMREWLLLK